MIWGRAFTDIGYRENVEGPCGKSSAFGECAAVAEVHSRLTYGYTPTRTALEGNAYCTMQNAQCRMLFLFRRAGKTAATWRAALL